MAYNYHESFLEQAISPRCRHEIIVAACLAYRMDHPDAKGELRIRIFVTQKTVEMTGEDVVYFTFRELGITSVY